MALSWDWTNQANQAPSPYIRQPEGPSQGGGGMQFNMGGGRLPNLPPLGIPGVAPSPQLPSFNTDFPSLPGPQMAPMTVPQLQTQGLGLPSYQRPQYNDLSGGFQQIQQLLSGLLGQNKGPQQGPSANVSTPINASPLFSPAFSSGAISSVAGQAGRGMGGPHLPYATPTQQAALGQQYRTNAGREAQHNTSQLGRQMAGDNASFGLQSQQARSNAGLGLMNLLGDNWAQDQQYQNAQQNGLLGLLMGML